MSNKQRECSEELSLEEVLDKQWIEGGITVYKDKAEEILYNKEVNESREFTDDREMLEKFWLEEFDLWKPTRQIIIDDNYAWEEDGKWLYNIFWAILEADHLGQEIAEMTEIARYYKNNWKKMAEDLWLYRWHDKLRTWTYWSNTSSENITYAISFTDNFIKIIKANGDITKLTTGRSVRLKKRLA